MTEARPCENWLLEDLRTRVARIERGYRRESAGKIIPFGLAPLDAALPDGGLAQGALHEVFGAGADIEFGAAAALLVAGIVARLGGQKILWALEQQDLFAPALAAAGLHPDRVIYAEAGRPAAVLLVMEEALRHRGLAAVIGEFSGRLSLTGSRRLQLAAEQTGVTAFALRRSRRHDDPLMMEPTASFTRWRVGPVPAPPVLAHRPETPGLGRPRWRLELLRCRGGRPAAWIVEACDAAGHLGLAADLGDGSPAQMPARRAAAG